ncbi:MAG: hypothetical protein VKI42_05510 [Synechococcaceae cyanobacterium]|nr:hypothetical protein [Synechococcaceae cyanobacterium]
MRTKPRRPMAEWQAGLVLAGMVVGGLLLLTWLLPVFLFGCLFLTSVVAPIQIGRGLWRQRRR